MSTTITMSTEILVYPSPFDHFINIEVTCEEGIDCIILLADLNSAKIIRILGAGLSKGFNKIPIGGLHALPLGAYNLDIKTPTGDSIFKTEIIKQ